MIRDIRDLYNRNLLSIIFISCLLVIPYSIFTLSMIEYVQTSIFIELDNIVAVFFIILNFSVLVPPYLYLVKKDYREEEIKVTEALKLFTTSFGYIFFFSFLFYAIGTLGSILLFIPSIIAALFLFLLPLYADKESIKESLQKVLQTLKKEHLFIFLDILLILCLNYLIWSGAVYLIDSFENNTFVYMLIRSLLNAIFLPIIYFYLFYKYRLDLGDHHE
ncbi:hypothetical protein [Mangrovibacillus cuniculi]|uniref:Beta-carotene 15,15'-monooxygenase n=1 Tax=Mangrovibacillus cuniculi TaxID=2593652 RepID=A0A7S8CE11_9BACI|nr:hypothetical protein [Mangrovibacillus cuniculi]QPC48279.1 hypothetical protein G8O30_15810 [Mangrovibacillus cuniculi]